MHYRFFLRFGEPAGILRKFSGQGQKTRGRFNFDPPEDPAGRG
jgi:hypothetical protein